MIGIDFTDAMIEKARTNEENLGFQNVEFRMADIERIPVAAGTADAIITWSWHDYLSAPALTHFLQPTTLVKKSNK